MWREGSWADDMIYGTGMPMSHYYNIFYIETIVPIPRVEEWQTLPSPVEATTEPEPSPPTKEQPAPSPPLPTSHPTLRKQVVLNLGPYWNQIPETDANLIIMAMRLMSRNRSSYCVRVTCIDPTDWIHVLDENDIDTELDMEIMECEIEDSDRAIRVDM